MAIMRTKRRRLHAVAYGETGMIQAIRSFVRAEDGATAIEYVLIASFLALAIITAVTGIGTKLSTYFSEVSSAIK
jgi:pilus assembly protein Flp/PilA